MLSHRGSVLKIANRASFYPYALRKISVLTELALGHLRYSLTDVPPQPNSPPDTVIRAARPTREGSSLRREARRDAGPRGPAIAARRFTD